MPLARNIKPEPLVVLAQNIRSMYNVGAFFRTADAAGVSRLILGGYTATPPRKEISKTALHADEHLPWEHWKQPWRGIKDYGARGYRVVALENNVEHSQDIFGYQPHDHTLLMVGNEVDGLSDTMLSYADDVVAIPMHGSKESLNVAVAFGIAVYYFANKIQK